MSPNIFRWLSFVAVLWLQSLNGTNLSFPAYSSQLKEFLSISQLKLSYLSFASDAGKVVGFVSGIVAAHLPLQIVLLVGSSLGLVGYGLQYLSFAKKMFTLSFPQIWILSFLAGNSICWINTVCFIVAINSFPYSRQVAVGITTSYQGLSGKIYTDIVHSFFNSTKNDAASGYLLLNSLVPLVACAVTAPMLVDKTTTFSSYVQDQVGYELLFGVTVITGIYAVITSLVSLPAALVLIGMTMLLLAPISIPLGFKLYEVTSPRTDQQKVHDVESQIYDSKKEDLAIENAIADVIEEIEWTQLWKKLDFWIYFSLYLFGPTAAIVFMNNLGQIAESRGCTATSTLVALSSSVGFFGRLLPSMLSYFFSKNKRMPSTTVSMAVSLVLIVFSYLLLLVTDSNIAIYVSTAAISICSGALSSLSATLTTELFGTKDFGINHNIVIGNIPIGSFVYGLIAANVYRNGAAKIGDTSGKCIGMHCFRTTLIVWALLSSLALVLATVLYRRRHRKFYTASA